MQKLNLILIILLILSYSLYSKETENNINKQDINFFYIAYTNLGLFENPSYSLNHISFLYNRNSQLMKSFYAEIGLNMTLGEQYKYGLNVGIGYKIHLLETFRIIPILSAVTDFKRNSSFFTLGINSDYFIKTESNMIEFLIIGLNLRYLVDPKNNNNSNMYHNQIPFLEMKFGIGF